MSDESTQVQVPPTPEEVREILEREPAIAMAVTSLEEAIEALDQIQQEVLPQQEKGLQIPNLEHKLHTAQTKIATALDTLVASARTCEDPEIMGIAMGFNQAGVAYMQGILYGVHYSRMMVAHHGNRTNERLLHEAYALLQRAQQRKTSRIVTP